MQCILLVSKVVDPFLVSTCFRYLLHILLLQMDTPELKQAVCTVLASVLKMKVMAAKEKSENFLGLLGCFRSVVSKITECIEDSATSISQR